MGKRRDLPGQIADCAPAALGNRRRWTRAQPRRAGGKLQLDSGEDAADWDLPLTDPAHAMTQHQRLSIQAEDHQRAIIDAALKTIEQLRELRSRDTPTGRLRPARGEDIVKGQIVWVNWDQAPSALSSSRENSFSWHRVSEGLGRARHALRVDGRRVALLRDTFIEEAP